MGLVIIVWRQASPKVKQPFGVAQVAVWLSSGGVLFSVGASLTALHVVQVPGYADVGIYADNQLSTRTDSKGNALLTGLRSYQKNSVRIEQSDIPLDAQIDTLQLDAVPYFRSGLVLKFPVKRSRGALLSVVLENGEPLPAGAQVANYWR